MEFYARVRPISTTDTKEIVWEYSKDNIISIGPADESSYSTDNAVNKYKIVSIGNGGGEVTVTGTVKGTDITATFKVAVDSEGTGFTFSQTSPQKLILGKSNNNTTSIAIENNNPFSMAKNVKWTLTDDSIVDMRAINSSKTQVVLTAKQVGTTTLKAEVEYYWGGTYSQEIEIVVEAPRIDILVDGEVTDTINIAVGETKGFLVEPNYKKDSADDGYQSSSYDPSIILLDGDVSKNSVNGLYYTVTGVAEGTQAITFTPTDTTCSPVTLTINVGGGTSAPGGDDGDNDGNDDNHDGNDSGNPEFDDNSGD
jgi:hypothetical protein